jgi:hypothetical protein
MDLLNNFSVPPMMKEPMLTFLARSAKTRGFYDWGIKFNNSIHG